MTKIKIRSNPYTREISYLTMDDATGEWIDVKQTDDRSRLRETDSERSFLPFKIREIINIILKEYYIGREKVELQFEGTQDEFAEVATVCEADDVKDKIELIRTSNILENARFIKGDIKEVFERVNPVIENIMKEDASVTRGLKKVSQALDDVIPLCVFGNYSAGKSTFINALVGVEILPSGGDPVTAKIYEIRNNEQPDQAKICFEFHKERIEISIEGKEFRVLKGNSETEIIKSIKDEIDNDGTYELYTMVRIAMDIINNYEKRDKEIVEIGNVITLVVPFSSTGVIGNSANKFVIFDTPGSNSNSNQDHAEVLAEAMNGFSNGIPVWVTQYDAHDTKDNAELCDKVLAIDSLDKRFTMIIFNKSDDADLPEKGFSEKQIKEILEYRAIEKMYASGIFFVSSIMGLGAKNNEEFVDRFYRKTFRMQNPAFSDPEDIDYMTLYKYNIMPEQIKQNAMEYSSNNENLVYANSGLYCVEKEIENFGSKHSAYNKCQMVFAFLSSVVQKTNIRIEERTKVLKDARERSKQELDAKSVRLQEEIELLAKNMEDTSGRSSKVDIGAYTEQNFNYQFDVEQLSAMDSERRKQNFEESDFASKEKGYQEAKDKLWDHLKESSQGLFSKNFVKSVKNMANDLSHDFKNLQESKDKMDSSERELDKLSSEQILEYVIKSYKVNIDDAQERLSYHLDDYWRGKELDFKRALILEITKTDALSDAQREEIEKIIQSFDVNDFKNQADAVFVRKKFLRKTLLGLHLSDDEKLDIKRLTKSYNGKIRKITSEMAQKMNEDCFEQFKIWEEKLLSEIYANLTEYNPELKSIAEIIRIETENITELENNQKLIQSSLDTIIELMSWKVAEGE